MSLVGALISLLRGGQFYYDDAPGGPRPAQRADTAGTAAPGRHLRTAGADPRAQIRCRTRTRSRSGSRPGEGADAPAGSTRGQDLT